MAPSFWGMAGRLAMFQTLPFLVITLNAPLFLRGGTLDGVVFFSSLVLPFLGTLAFCWWVEPYGHRFWMPLGVTLVATTIALLAFEVAFLWMEVGPRWLHPVTVPGIPDRTLWELIRARANDSEALYVPVMAGFSGAATLRIVGGYNREGRL